MTRGMVAWAGILGFLGVAAGAFGAHTLRNLLDPDRLAIFETGARYQLVHAVALLGLAALQDRRPGTPLAWAARCFVTGVIVFSGSLYALALSDIRWLGAVTPVGGIFMLAGWLVVAWTALRQPGPGDRRP